MAKPDTLIPRKIPRQRRSQATVDAILEAAAHILEAEGYGGYSTNTVAQRAGVSIGSLYQYFPNKDAITRALNRSRALALSTDIEVALATKGQSCGLSRVIATAVDYQLKRPALARFLDAEEERLPPDPETSRLARSVADRIAAALHERNFAGDPAEASRDIISIIRGMVDGAGQRSEINAGSLITRVERAVFGYLREGCVRPLT